MTTAATVVPTRFGPLLVVIDEAAVGDRSSPWPGAVVASGFHPTGEQEVGDSSRVPLLDYVRAAVADWDSGADLAALDRVPVAVAGSGFRERAWRALREVPVGATVSYGELAGRAGRGRAARAAGSACATNPVAPFVPCHRVVRSGGALGAYGYGTAMKQAMLQHERALP